MAEQQATVKFPGTSPEPRLATRFSLTVTGTDLILAMGHVRLAYDPSGKSAGGSTQYTSSYSLSPTAAKQLMAILGVSLDRYEEQFGKIPVDAAVMKAIVEPKQVRPKGKVVPIKSAAGKRPAKRPAKR